jgi:uncharacterized protein YbbC (DUF1343 family)
VRATDDGAATAGAAVETGLDGLVRGGFAVLRGRRVALMTHPAGVLATGAHCVDVLREGGVDVRVLLGVEHGVRGSTQAGLTETATLDPGTGLPVVNTYGANVPEIARELAASRADTVVVDLQHSGARFFTYESSLFDVMAAAAIAELHVVVLDRPIRSAGRWSTGRCSTPRSPRSSGARESRCATG